MARLGDLVAYSLTPRGLTALWQRRFARGQAPETALWRFRNFIMLAMIERDVTQQAPVAEVCTAVTTVEELAINHASRVGAQKRAAAWKLLLGRIERALQYLDDQQTH